MKKVTNVYHYGRKFRKRFARGVGARRVVLVILRHVSDLSYEINIKDKKQ
jgi:hypothetical protein